MNFKKSFTILITLLFTFTIISNISAISSSVKSQQDYNFMLTSMQKLRIIISNFGTEEQKKEYDNLKAKFQKAAERHYSQSFVKETTLTENTTPDNNQQASVEMFYQLKIEVNALFSEIAAQYIERTKNVLDSTSTQATNIIIEYSKNSGMAKYFYRPIDPLKEKKPYDTKKYHYFHKRSTIESYLKNGYKLLEDARRIYKHPDYIYINSKKKKSSRELDYLISNHQNVIKLTRDAKQSGIAIYQILNEQNLDTIMKKYNITMGQINKYPVYDDRIPEKYKVDMIDANKMIFEVEVKRIPNYEQYQNNNNNQESDTQE